MSMRIRWALPPKASSTFEPELLPHPGAARVLIAERLAETAAAARRIELPPKQASVLAAVGSRLEHLAGLLRS